MDYQRGNLIGSGGMAEVFYGRRIIDGAPVALKYLRPQYSGDPEIRERFIREAQTCYNLKHPNIVRVTAMGTDGGQPYLVMEFLEGETLRLRLLRSCRGEIHPLSERDAISIAEQVLAGLEAAHNHVDDNGTGVVHRDIKPGNIFLTNADGVKVIDFGIAKVQEATKDLTVMGSQLGTVEYMSPEQILGEQVDRRADLYAVGIVLFEMLTGEPPFTSDHSTENPRRNEVMRHQVSRQPPSLPGTVSVGLQKIIARALDKKPERRFKTAQAMRAALLSLPQAAVEPPSRNPGPQVVEGNAGPIRQSDERDSETVIRPGPIGEKNTIGGNAPGGVNPPNPLKWMAIGIGFLAVLAMAAGGLKGTSSGDGPTIGETPTPIETATPTAEPTAAPTQAPTQAPTAVPTEAPKPAPPTSAPPPPAPPTPAPPTPAPALPKPAPPTPAPPPAAPLRTVIQSRYEAIPPGAPEHRYNDSAPRGQMKVIQSAVTGKRKINVEVKLRGDKTESRRFVNSEIVVAPRNAIYEFGTKATPVIAHPRVVIRSSKPRPVRKPRRIARAKNSETTKKVKPLPSLKRNPGRESPVPFPEPRMPDVEPRLPE